MRFTRRRVSAGKQDANESDQSESERAGKVERMPGTSDSGEGDHEAALVAEAPTAVTAAPTTNGGPHTSGEAGQPPGRNLAVAPTRLCPHCATLSYTAGDFCPHCGKPFSGGSRAGVSTRVKLASAGVVLLLVLGGAGVAVAIKVHHDNQVTAQHRRAAAATAAATHAREQAAARAKAAQQAKQAARKAARAAEVEQRQGLESQLQTEITKDATKKVNAGLLVSGPAQSTTCTPVNGGSSQKLSESTGTYTCLAIYQTNSDGTSSGYGYSGTINFETGMFTWQLERGG